MTGFLFTFPPAPVEAPQAPQPDLLYDSPGRTPKPPRDFREYAKSLAPFFLSYVMGEKLVGWIGLMSDLLVEGAQQATLAGSQFSTMFPPDALALVGSERHLPQYPGESYDQYFARVWGAWEIWEQAGSDIGIIAQYAAYGATCEVINNWDWDWDGHPEKSRTWHMLTDHGIGAPLVLGDGHILGGGSTLGSSASADQVRAARTIARTFRAGHIPVEYIVVVLDDSSPIVPDGTWDESGNRSPLACYWPG